MAEGGLATDAAAVADDSRGARRGPARGRRGGGRSHRGLLRLLRAGLERRRCCRRSPLGGCIPPSSSAARSPAQHLAPPAPAPALPGLTDVRNRNEGQARGHELGPRMIPRRCRPIEATRSGTRCLDGDMLGRTTGGHDRAGSCPAMGSLSWPPSNAFSRAAVSTRGGPGAWPRGV